jgi:hypothetical protein
MSFLEVIMYTVKVVLYSRGSLERIITCKMCYFGGAGDQQIEAIDLPFLKNTSYIEIHLE